MGTARPHPLRVCNAGEGNVKLPVANSHCTYGLFSQSYGPVVSLVIGYTTAPSI